MKDLKGKPSKYKLLGDMVKKSD